jgi:hypothetical protein
MNDRNAFGVQKGSSVLSIEYGQLDNTSQYSKPQSSS